MQVIDINQNTEEWLKFRRGKSGGSEFKDLYPVGVPLKTKVVEMLESNGPLSPADKKLTVGELADMLTPEELAELKMLAEPKRRYYEIIAERVARPIIPDDYIDKLDGKPFSMMARGHLLEPEAIAAFENKTKKHVDGTSVVWVSDYDDMAYVSPDATITDGDGRCREAVEVKCLDSWQIVRAWLTNEPPAEYMSQVLKYFMVNKDLETLYLVLYTDAIPGLDLQIFPIVRRDVEREIEIAVEFERKTLDRIRRDVEKIELLGF